MDIRPEWAVKEQVPFAALGKLSCNVGDAEDLGDYGAVEFYDKAYDKITARMEKPLERTQVRGGALAACVCCVPCVCVGCRRLRDVWRPQLACRSRRAHAGAGVLSQRSVAVHLMPMHLKA